MTSTAAGAALPSQSRAGGTLWNSRAARRFRRNRLAVIGLGLVLAFALVAAFAPLLAPPTGNCLRDLGVQAGASAYDPTGPLFWKAIFRPAPACYSITRVSFSQLPTPPGVGATLGTTGGYDVWYGLVWGTRTAFYLGLTVVFWTLLIGVTLGSLAGYFGAWVDNLVMRVTDVLSAFPTLVLTIVLITLLGPSLRNIAVAFILVGWGGYARVVRGEILRVRQLEYVEGARAMGAGHARIILRHVLPNSLTSVTVLAVLNLGSIPLSAAALSFLGIGLPVGYTDWGQIVSFARAFIQGPPGNPFGYWYVITFPALTIILYGLGWNLLGDALRDALDPRER